MMPPRTTLRRNLRRLALVTAITVAIVGLLAWRRIANVAALQDSLERDWEINFNGGTRPWAWPEFVDEAADSFIRRLIGPERDPLFFREKGNRTEVWDDRLRTLFKGRITDIEIYYPGRLTGDLGSALARFPALRRLAIRNPDFTASEWSYVFAGLQHLSHLEELEIGGEELRDTTIEPLANQPSLRKITIERGKLGNYCGQTFARLPKLSELVFESDSIDDGHDPHEAPFPEIQKLIREDLPNVRVTFQ